MCPKPGLDPKSRIINLKSWILNPIFCILKLSNPELWLKSQDSEFLYNES